jgi:hypothetical protein
MTCPVCPDGPGHLVVQRSPELLDHLRAQAPPCVDCGRPVAEWDPRDPLYRLGRQQCPACIRADIDNDRRHVRREDIRGRQR